MADLTFDIPEELTNLIGPDFVQEVLERKFAEALVLCEKQADYGPYNIARPPAGITPQQALLVRLNDKIQRLGHLGERDVSNEAKKDSWSDGSNYFTIGGMIEDGVWPGLNKEV